MAIPNVDKITSTLARLPDQALQQYAQMHKNDPYIMSLAVSESNRRKELRAAAQAPQGMQEQPKVADAALAQMAPPQEQGIAALPAPNMQMMADGGIAGYEGFDEGATAYGQEPVMRMAGGGHVPRYQGNQRDGSLVMDTLYDPVSGVPLMAPTNVGVEDDRTLMERLGIFNPENRRALERAEQAAAKRTAKPAADKAAQDLAQFDAASNAYMAERAVKPPKKPSAGKANIVPPPKQEATAEKGTPEGGLASLFKAQTPQQLKAEADTMAKGDIERMNKEYSPFLEELKAEKEAIGNRKESNVGEALLRAGLGMMGGKSRNALENISAGATAGLDAYVAAQKADEAARRALRQSEMSIMQAQRAERSGYHKDAVALMNNSRQQEQFAVSSAQHAEQIKNTKAYQEGSLANQRIMAEAARTRASAVGGGAEDKHTALLLKVQTVLQNNPAYKKAAEFAALPGSAGDKARATMKQLEETAYRQFAPELLQSGQASPTGAGSGLDLSQWGKSQVVKP